MEEECNSVEQQGGTAEQWYGGTVEQCGATAWWNSGTV